MGSVISTMSQLSWTLLDDYGGKHEVGLYHGDRSKHLLIHINMKPTIIDFGMKETKTYSFYVEDELCELHVQKDGSGYSYSFKTNRKIDTPLNKTRNDRQKIYLVITLAIAVFFILIVGILMFVFGN